MFAKSQCELELGTGLPRVHFTPATSVNAQLINIRTQGRIQDGDDLFRRGRTHRRVKHKRNHKWLNLTQLETKTIRLTTRGAQKAEGRHRHSELRR